HQRSARRSGRALLQLHQPCTDRPPESAGFVERARGAISISAPTDSSAVIETRSNAQSGNDAVCKPSPIPCVPAVTFPSAGNPTPENPLLALQSVGGGARAKAQGIFGTSQDVPKRG